MAEDFIDYLFRDAVKVIGSPVGEDTLLYEESIAGIMLFHAMCEDYVIHGLTGGEYENCIGGLERSYNILRSMVVNRMHV